MPQWTVSMVNCTWQWECLIEEWVNGACACSLCLPHIHAVVLVHTENFFVSVPVSQTYKGLRGTLWKPAAVETMNTL